MKNPAPKRGNQYYLDRLRDEHPVIFADYLAGKFKNASEAFVLAGLRTKRSALNALRSAWAKASPTERDAFRVLIGCVTPLTAPAPVSPKKTTPAISTATQTAPISSHVPNLLGADGRLEPSAVAHIRAVMDRRKIKMGTIMKELGFKPLNASLGRAMERGTNLNNALLVEALADWLRKNPKMV